MFIKSIPERGIQRKYSSLNGEIAVARRQQNSIFQRAVVCRVVSHTQTWISPYIAFIVLSSLIQEEEEERQQQPTISRRPKEHESEAEEDLSKSLSKMVMAMVTLIVATTTDPASINPASALLSMPSWQPGPSFEGISSFVNGQIRLLRHDKGIVEEDDLDRRWEEATGEVVENLIFLSKHTAVSNRPALTVHPIGVPHLRDGDVPPQGGKPGWAAPPDPRMGPWLRLLKKIAESHNLVPEFEVTLEGTHHGPVTNKPTMFLEIGSTEEYWKRHDAAQVIALVEFIIIAFGLGLGGDAPVGNWDREKNDTRKVLLGIGGGHYAPRHMDIVLKDGVWVGHLLSGYSVQMEDPIQSKAGENVKTIGGTWREAIKVAFEATKSAFPEGEIIAHLDHKSFKGWQKNALTGFLAEQNIKIGKPKDF